MRTAIYTTSFDETQGPDSIAKALLDSGCYVGKSPMNIYYKALAINSVP